MIIVLNLKNIYIDSNSIIGIPIEKFLFNIYPFEGNVKETVSDLSELSFLYDFTVVRRSDLNLDYFLGLSVKNEISSCETSQDEISSKNTADLDLGKQDKFRLCGKRDKNKNFKEGIVEFKIKDLDDTCDEIVKTEKMPQNWEKFKFEDNIVGCFTAQDNTSFSLDNFLGTGTSINQVANPNEIPTKGNEKFQSVKKIKIIHQ